VLNGTQELEPRWKRCVRSTDRALGELLGQPYVQRNFPPAAKARTLKMVQEIEGAMERDIDQLPWMSETTKKQALVKLHAVANKIGYPEHWRDYSSLNVVRGDYVGNQLRSDTFEFRRNLGKIGKPVDKTEWGMTPPTVNAYYSPNQNNINFPAGILQPPFYDNARDEAINYGGVGAVVGHELTHGFDDQGAKFDPQGNLRDWWSPQDKQEFEQRTGCEVNEYDQFVATEDVHVRGKLTLGENTADNGGLRLAYMAMEKALANDKGKNAQGFTKEQLLFLGWGQVWCENARPEYSRVLAQTNPHSPGKFRVIGVVQNMPEFQQAYGCKAGQPMVKENACRVW
jgi:predicted metalloendopeptidase